MKEDDSIREENDALHKILSGVSKIDERSEQAKENRARLLERIRQMREPKKCEFYESTEKKLKSLQTGSMNHSPDCISTFPNQVTF